MSAGCKVSCCPWSWGKYFTTSHMIQDIYAIYCQRYGGCGLQGMILWGGNRKWHEGWYSSLLLGGDGGCIRSLLLNRSSWFTSTGRTSCPGGWAPVAVIDLRLSATCLQHCIKTGYLEETNTQRKLCLKTKTALDNNTLSKLEDYKDYNWYSSNFTLTVHACGQCTCVNLIYCLLVFSSDTSLLTLLQH